MLLLAVDSNFMAVKKLSIIHIVFVILLACLNSFGQTIIEGSVTDAFNNERLIGVEVRVIGSSQVVQTNIDGRFLISLDLNEAKTLNIHIKGYQRQHITVIEPARLSVALERIYSQGFRKLKETGVGESELLDAGYGIDHVSGQEILEMPNGLGVDGLNNFHSMFAARPEDRMMIWDFRGFASTEFSRAIHATDGINISIPDLGSSIGSMTTPTEIDIASIELRSSPASTLMGSGAYSGVVAYSTKTPWQQRGLTVSARGATGSEFDLQARFAQLLDKKQRFGIKITGQFNRLDANTGTNKGFNIYGNLNHKFEYDEATISTKFGLTPVQNSLAKQYINWVKNEGKNASLKEQSIVRAGFLEDEVAKQQMRILKLNGALYFKINPAIQLNYNYRMSYGSGIYQADSRFNLSNFIWQQHSLKAKGKQWEINAHGSFSHSGNSYNINGTANLINEAGSSAFLKNQLLAYLDTMDQLSSGFTHSVSDQQVNTAFDYAQETGNSGWYVHGTNRFDSISEAIQNSTIQTELSSLKLRSSSQGIKGKYLFDLKWMSVLVGMNFKRESPGSEGGFYLDSIGNLSFVEVGGIALLSSNFFREKLNIKLGNRVTKNELFNTQMSPTGSISYRFKNRFVWAGFQSGFRNPNYWELFRDTYNGAKWQVGNSQGYQNRLIESDIEKVQTLLSQALSGTNWPSQCTDGDLECLYRWAADSLASVTLKSLQPERVNSIELGYRSVILKNLFLDVVAHYSIHTDRIHYTSISQLAHSDLAHAVESINMDSSISTMSVPVNATEPLYTMGGSLNLTYHFSDRVWANANYTYSKLLTDNHESLITAGFNVPDHRFNLGLRLRRIWKGLGFSANFRLNDSFTWQSRAGSIEVPWTSILDAQLSYQIPKLHSTFRVGGSNILNTPYINVAGGSTLANTFYASILFDLSVQ
ncbi:MAG: iron complex outermembrane receptor protein [Granulosicoccus sp.]|jgi:iron complex outermembrane receptor protein